MRILFGSASCYPEENGVSTFLQYLAPTLKARGHDVEIFCPSNGLKNERRTVEGIDVFAPKSLPFPMNKQFRVCVSPVLQRVIKRELQRFKPDVIHVQDPFLISLALAYTAKKMNIPIVGTHHTDVNMYQEYFPIVPDKILNRVADVEWSLLCWFLSQMDAVTTPTKAASAPLKQHGLKKEVLAISNGIDLHHFSVDKNTGVRKKYGIDISKQVILSVGRLDPEKNVDVVIRAFDAMHSHENGHLMIVGKGVSEKKLQALVKKLGLEQSVTFTGHIEHDELPDYYRAADVFVAAGHLETQSLVTLEAMASGLPVVAANALALPELVEDGDNGYTFKVNDVAALTACLTKVCNSKDLMNTMGKRSRERAELHDKAHTVEAFEKVYQSVQ